MALDPRASLSVASAIIQFLRVGFRLVAEVHSCVEGGYESSLHEDIQTDLVIAHERLAGRLWSSPKCPTAEEQAFDNLRAGCKTVADDILIRLQSGALLASEHEQAAKVAWIKEDIDALAVRLSAFKVEFETRTVLLLQQIIDDLPSGTQDGTYQNLDELVPIISGRRALLSAAATDLGYTGATLDSFDVTAEDTSDDSFPTENAANSSDKTILLQEFILESLGFKSMKDRQSEVSAAHRKTFEWIFGTEPKQTSPGEKRLRANFSEWLEGDTEDGIYWINGKAGSGKSTLMRFIYDNAKTAASLQRWAGQYPLTTAGFFFWTSGSLEQRSQSGLLRYLLFQLLSKHPGLIAPSFPRIWSHYWKASTMERIKNPISWTLSDLTLGLRRFFRLSHHSTKTCLFIDGLDEFDGDHQGIISFVKGIIKSSPHMVKMCLSSRPWPVFEAAFQDVSNLKLQDLTFNDMYRYVRDRLRSDPRMLRVIKNEPDSFEHFINEAVQRADGVFLWVALAVRFVLSEQRQGDGMSDVLQRLRLLPTDLNELFHQFLFHLQPKENLKDASKIFQLIRAREVVCEYSGDYTTASLSVRSLALALEDRDPEAMKAPVQRVVEEEMIKQCEETKKRVESRCAGLLEVHERRGSTERTGPSISGEEDDSDGERFIHSKVKYLHRTVRDFLVYSGIWSLVLEQTIGISFDPHLCHLQAYILQLKRPLGEPRRHRRLDEWWSEIVVAMTHARYSSVVNRNIQVPLVNELNKTLISCWLPKKTVPNDNWARSAFGSYEERNKSVIHEPFLSLCVKFGLSEYLQDMLTFETVTRHGGQPILSYAIDFLVGRRSTVYPLSDPELVSIVLDAGADPNQVYGESASKQETPWIRILKYAREANRRGWIKHFDIEDSGTVRWTHIMNIFLQHGADANAVILQDRWDPSASALDVVNMIMDKTPSKLVQDLRDLLLEKIDDNAGDHGITMEMGNAAVDS